MKKSAKAAVAATAVAALYGAAAYGVTRTLMDVAMKRDMPKALQHKAATILQGRAMTSFTARRRKRRRTGLPLRKRRRCCLKTATD